MPRPPRVIPPGTREFRISPVALDKWRRRDGTPAVAAILSRFTYKISVRDRREAVLLVASALELADAPTGDTTALRKAEAPFRTALLRAARRLEE